MVVVYLPPCVNGSATVAMAVSLDEGLKPDRHKEPPPRTDGRVIDAKMPTFTIFDATFMAISMVTFVVDIGTDLHLVARYFIAGSLIWASLTLSLVLIPAIVVMVLSMRWHISDELPVTKVYWAAHICLWGIMHRYVLMFKTGVKARKTEDLADFDDLYRQQSDVCMLRMFESFMESAPQLVLQLYIMMSYHDYRAWTSITAFTSMVSLGWGIAAYTKAMRNTRLDKHKMTLSGLILQTIWRVGMISARVAALALVATVLEGWLLLIMGLHLLAMFLWVVSQKTGFSTTEWEESIFNLIMAVTYCFCFFNLKEGHSRWRMLTFYVVIVTENIAFVLTYYIMSHHKPWLKYTALAIVFGGMTLGLVCMALYYRYLHPVGPLNPFVSWFEEEVKDTENGKDSFEEQCNSYPDCNGNTRSTAYRPSVRRDFKYLYPFVSKSSNSVLSAPGVSLESSPVSYEIQTSASIPPLLTHQRPLEIMCSVQDLLANVSCSSDIQIVSSPEEECSNDNASGEISNGARKNEVPEENHELSPSSLERSVTRELNRRLSSSEFQDVIETKLISSEVGTNEQNENELRMTEKCYTQSVPSEKCHNQVGMNENYLKKIEINLHQNQIGVSELPSQLDESSNSVCTPHFVGNENIPCSLVVHDACRYSSPNSIGLPYKSKSSSQTSLNSIHTSGSQCRSASILRTSVKRKDRTVSDPDMRLTSLPQLTTSTVNITSKSQDGNDKYFEDPDTVKSHVPNVELAVIDRMHIIETESSGMSSEGHSDYENIYEGKDNLRRNLPPKPSNLIVQNLNETQTTQSSVPHDYENICAVNINREMWGVRHWKTYSDIEDRIHDNSTYKERLQMLDSTLASSHQSEYSAFKGIYARRSISMVDDSESVLSRSLPDLSALRLETCYEEPEEEVKEACTSVEVQCDNRLMDVLNQLRANRPMNKSNSFDDIPNYESIWIGDVEKPENDNISSHMTSSTSRSSLVVTIGDVHAKESLCNLYYSTMSDLSFRYYSERLRKNNSVGSLASRRSIRDASREMIRAISVPDNKTLLEVSELIEEQRKLEENIQTVDQVQAVDSTNLKIEPLHYDSGVTPVRSEVCTQPRRKFSLLRERFEHPNWALQKSPLKQRQPAQRRNSLQDRTAKALQAGMKVFRRPRVHVITPRKGDDCKDTPRLKSPFKSKSITPSTPAIRVNVETPTESKLKSKVESEVGKSLVQRTPQIKTPTDCRLTKRTPKTSTPDSAKQSTLGKLSSAVDPRKMKKVTEGPKTSTPEGNKPVPQVSILSAVSSVVPSPENHQPRIPLSENLHQNRISSRSLAMQVIQETEYAQKVTHQGSLCNKVILGKSAGNQRTSKLPACDENSQEIQYSTSPSSSLQNSQSLLDVKTAWTPSQDDHRFSNNQAMFSGALGLPQFYPDSRTTIISVAETTESPHSQQNISISRIILSSPQSPKFNLQKSTLSPNSKIFSRRI